MMTAESVLPERAVLRIIVVFFSFFSYFYLNVFEQFIYILCEGLLWRLVSHDFEMEITEHTRQLMTGILKEESGLETGWVQTGGLFTAYTKERMDAYKAMATVSFEPECLVSVCSLISVVLFILVYSTLPFLPEKN